jgi:hypothetical protein
MNWLSEYPKLYGLLVAMVVGLIWQVFAVRSGNEKEIEVRNR